MQQCFNYLSTCPELMHDHGRTRDRKKGLRAIQGKRSKTSAWIAGYINTHIYIHERERKRERERKKGKEREKDKEYPLRELDCAKERKLRRERK